MEIILLIIISVGAVILLLAFVYLSRVLRYYRRSEEKYPVACAGTYEKGIDKADFSFSISKGDFRGHNDQLLDVEDYDFYVVNGESMSLCGIHDKNLLFVKKGFSVDRLSQISFPDILILKRDEASESEAQYKVRRAWKIVRSGEDVNKLLHEIIESSAFEKIRGSDKYPGDDAVLKDFADVRLKRYREKYSKVLSANAKDNVALISTTLHMKEREIYFSIHPAASVVGQVAYSFDVSKMK